MNAATQQDASRLAQPITRPLAECASWSLDRAYEYCERLTRSHYENFPVGSVLVPKRLRKHFCSIYAFARIADDFADEGYEEGFSEIERLEAINEWQSMLRAALAGRAKHPVFVALAHTISEFKLPGSLFEDLLSAFAQDVTVRRYQNRDQLLDYCRRSANPIGRLVLLLFGYRDEQRHEWSDEICTALQLTNHWQDVEIDLGKDRIYLPQDDLARFEITVSDLITRQPTLNLKPLMEYEVEFARAMFERGKPLCRSVTGRLGLELRSVWLGGMRILERIKQNDYDVFERRPVITFPDKLMILIGAASKRAFQF